MVKIIVVALLLMVAGCQSGPSISYRAGDVVFEDDFSGGFGWDHFTYENITVGVTNEAYEMRSDRSEFVRGFNTQSHADVVIEVDARQLSPYENNAYGVICRASPSSTASGYYFLIGGDGTYSIRKGRDQEVVALTRWTNSDAIQRGLSRNVMRAVCVGDYLALYVNGKFMAETRDSSYQSGYTGLTVAVGQGEEIDVRFDNLVIREATLAGD